MIFLAITSLFRVRDARRRASRRRALAARVRTLESLEGRVTPAIVASFDPTVGILTVLGDAGKNTIAVGRDAAGALEVNGGAVKIAGGTATVADTHQIALLGQGGDDNLSLDETNGPLPAASLFGGDGNDTLSGGAGDDQLFGQGGSDTLLGQGGFDILFGGDGNDTLVGGTGTDEDFGEAGNDQMIWNQGEGSDLNEGGDGNDTVVVNGGDDAENFTIAALGDRVIFRRVSPAPFALDTVTNENLVLHANGGDDTISAGTGLAPLIRLTLDGGDGNDTILGGDGSDTILGGDGNDFVDGNKGNDVALMGAGDDVFQWDPGDGNDTIEGQAGTDTMLFNGADVDEKIDISADGNRVRFVRDVASVTMDLNDVEAIDFNALGGADTVTVNDVSGTDLAAVNLNLAAAPGGAAGDGQSDLVVLNGTPRNDSVAISGQGTSVTAAGLSALVRIDGAEGGFDEDELLVNGAGGNDQLNASTLAAGVIQLALDGGAGNDSILGSAGVDTVDAGAGNDFVDGNGGDDLAFLGAGNDVFQWDPGDGSDTVTGDAGTDKLLFNGANVAEKIDISSVGTGVQFFRDVADVTMRLEEVEAIDFNALGGADTITVNDLSGTDVNQVNLNLGGVAGSPTPDGQGDRVIVNGTAQRDRIAVNGSAAKLAVAGLPARVNVTGADRTLDQLTIDARGGDDVVDASGLAANAVGLTLNGGDGNDVIIGSAGNDLVDGGTGDDVAMMHAGDDIFVWNPGDGSDTVEGQAGIDTMLFNGADVDEKIDISAHGNRVRFVRDVANVTMDLNDVEAIDFNAFGGADAINVGNLSGTDVKAVNLDLNSSAGSGDGQADSVIVNGTNRDDGIVVAGAGSDATVLGLAAQVNITGAEAANDRLTVNARAGDDVVDASSLAADAIQLTEDGGDGDDVLIGGAGADTLLGQAGDDVLIGGQGQDVLDGGSGSNILIQD